MSARKVSVLRANNITNLLLSRIRSEAVQHGSLDWLGLLEEEPDAGLGNGGLGRLAACFLDSMATIQLPAMGYGLRYEYGMFRQSIDRGWQREQPDNWLRRPDPWEVSRPDDKVEIELNCSFELRGGALSPIVGRPSTLIGLPFDRPVVGYGGKTINTLRLWAAAAPDSFDFQTFSHGDFVGALAGTLAAESLTRVLYPDDSTTKGQALRFWQEYFLVACSLADLIRRFRRANADWSAPPEKVAIQLNDTHPAIAVPELMRTLLDDAHLGWDQARTITDAIGDDWIADLGHLARLKPLAGDTLFREAIRGAKRAAKCAFAEWLRSTSEQTVDPDTIFDSQIKRIHEYKRQLLNAFSDHFSRNEPGVFAPLRDTLLTRDHYMHLADLASYLEADRRLCDLYADPDEWAGKAILNVASSGKFSAEGNWRWRSTDEMLSAPAFQSLRELTRASARSCSAESAQASSGMAAAP